jgi:hypothetical protein
LVYADGSAHSGVILIRLHGLRPADKAARVVMAISAHEGELHGAFTVIDKRNIRIRRLN